MSQKCCEKVSYAITKETQQLHTQQILLPKKKENMLLEERKNFQVSYALKRKIGLNY